MAITVTNINQFVFSLNSIVQCDLREENKKSFFRKNTISNLRNFGILKKYFASRFFLTLYPFFRLFGYYAEDPFSSPAVNMTNQKVRFYDIYSKAIRIVQYFVLSKQLI